jgi:hypothetical protein
MWIRNGDCEDWVDIVGPIKIIVPIESNIRFAARLDMPPRCARRRGQRSGPRNAERAHFERVKVSGGGSRAGQGTLGGALTEPQFPGRLSEIQKNRVETNTVKTYTIPELPELFPGSANRGVLTGPRG